MLPKKLKIVLKNGIIEEVSTHQDSSIVISDNKEYRFKDAYIIPAFVDSHCHLAGYGKILQGISLYSAKSQEECIEILKRSNKKRGKWIFARLWNNELWDEISFPDKKILDKEFPDTPVFLSRVDGHAAWVNSKALEIGNINYDTQDPVGGKIERFENGEASGILLDNAMGLLYKHIPRLSTVDSIEAIKLAQAECLKYGITAIHDMDVHPKYIDLYKKMDDNGELLLNINSFVSGLHDEYLEHNILPYRGNRFHITGVKFFMDGALGSRGAALTKSYKDRKDEFGLLLLSEEEFYQKAKKACEFGFQIACHAIGDNAVNRILNVYEKLRQEGFKNPLRIEHTQMISDYDADRMKKYNIIASIQPIHCTSDMEGMAQQRLTEDQLEISYRWKSLLQKGIELISGSDFPIESPNVFQGLDSYLNRKSNGISWNTGECLTLEEALYSYSTLPHSLSENNSLGNIQKGMKSDLLVLSKEILDPEKITQTKIHSIFINGKEIKLKNV